MNVEFINPGDLDRRVTIVRLNRTRGTKGQEIVERKTIATRSASVDIVSNDEDVEDSNVGSVHWIDVTMYRFPDMQVTDELEFDGGRYNITSINEVRMTPFIKVRARGVLQYEQQLNS